MKVIFTQSEATLTVRDIERVERDLCITFPEDNKSLLLLSNGGIPTPRKFIYQNNSKRYSDSLIDFFLSIYPDDSYSLESYFQRFKVEDSRLPKEFMPIANDPFGNLICMVIEGNKFGQIYFWDHEEEEDPPTDKNLYFVAKTITDFLNLLT